MVEQTSSGQGKGTVCMSICQYVCLYVSLPFCLSVSLYVFLSVRAHQRNYVPAGEHAVTLHSTLYTLHSTLFLFSTV